MSLSSVLFILCSLAMYKLGSFNARRPGVAWARCCDTSRWLWKWLQS